MTDQPMTIAEQRESLSAMALEMTEYLATLDAPTLLAELRCTLTRLVDGLTANHGRMDPFTLTTVVVTQAISRFDKAAPGTPLPEAVQGAELCLCETDHGGIRGRILRMVEFIDQHGDGREHNHEHHQLPPELAEQLAEAIKGIPGLNVGQIVAVPMVGGQQAGEPIAIPVEEQPAEPPAPGMYL